MKVITHQYKVSKNRGNNRIWIEGKNLLHSGFKANNRYTMEIAKAKIYLTLDSNGERKISGRQRANQTTVTPIIDICCDELSILGSAEKITAKFLKHQIIITW